MYVNRFFQAAITCYLEQNRVSLVSIHVKFIFMEALRMILLGISLLSALLLLIGMISPVTVLWWMAYQNRIRVLRLYGSILLVSVMIYLLL